MEGVIGDLDANGKIRTSETYMSALRSFRNFRCCRDLAFAKFDSQIAESYEAFLKNRGVCPNSSSFYMRIMRAVYNRAVDSGLTVQRYPFRHVYTGIGKTLKRAIPITGLRDIKNLKLEQHSALDFARDMFMFSFYTRGMAFVDMAYLKKRTFTAISSPTRDTRQDRDSISDGSNACRKLSTSTVPTIRQTTFCR